MKLLDCSVKRNMKEIKDQCEEEYLYALAHIDFFPECEMIISQRDIARISRNSRCQCEG